MSLLSTNFILGILIRNKDQLKVQAEDKSARLKVSETPAILWSELRIFFEWIANLCN